MNAVSLRYEWQCDWPLTSICCRITSTHREAEHQVHWDLEHSVLLHVISVGRDIEKVAVMTEKQGAGDLGVISSQFGNEWFRT